MRSSDEVLDFLRADLQQFVSSSRCPSRGGDEKEVDDWCSRRERREVLQQLRDGDQRRLARQEALQQMNVHFAREKSDSNLFNEDRSSGSISSRRSDFLDDGLVDPRVNAAVLIGENRVPQGVSSARRRGSEDSVFNTPLINRLLDTEQHPALHRRPSRRAGEAASYGSFDPDLDDFRGDECGAVGRDETAQLRPHRFSEEPLHERSVAPASASARSVPAASLFHDEATAASERGDALGDAIVERALAERVEALDRAARAEAAARNACRRQREAEAEAEEASAHAVRLGQEIGASREAMQALPRSAK